MKTRADRWELYDLLADRSETTNIAADHPEVLSRMKAGLEAWQLSVLRSYGGQDYRGQ